KYFYADRTRIMVYDRAAKTSVEWTPKLDRSCGAPSWSPDGDRIIFDIEDAGTHRIATLRGPNEVTLFKEPTAPVHVLPDGELPPLKSDALLPGPVKYSDTAPSVARDAKAVAYLRSSFEHPAQVWSYSNELKRHRIDRFNDELTSKWDLTPAREINYKGAGG